MQGLRRSRPGALCGAVTRALIGASPSASTAALGDAVGDGPAAIQGVRGGQGSRFQPALEVGAAAERVRRVRIVRAVHGPPAQVPAALRVLCVCPEMRNLAIRMWQDG